MAQLDALLYAGPDDELSGDMLREFDLAHVADRLAALKPHALHARSSASSSASSSSSSSSHAHAIPTRFASANSGATRMKPRLISNADDALAAAAAASLEGDDGKPVLVKKVAVFPRSWKPKLPPGSDSAASSADKAAARGKTQVSISPVGQKELPPQPRMRDLSALPSDEVRTE